MEALKVLRRSLETANSELAQAEIGLAEAMARASAARDTQAKLEAAVAALSGEPPASVVPTEAAVISQVAQGADAASNPADVGSSPTRPPNSVPSDSERADIQAMTPEEFDAHRKRQQRQRKKEEMANNPYAHIKCSGCGSLGTMNESIVQAPSGAPVRMMVCGSCGNQLIT